MRDTGKIIRIGNKLRLNKPYIPICYYCGVKISGEYLMGYAYDKIGWLIGLIDVCFNCSDKPLFVNQEM